MLHSLRSLSRRVGIKYLPFNEYANIIIYAQFRRFYAASRSQSTISLLVDDFQREETTVKEAARRPEPVCKFILYLPFHLQRWWLHAFIKRIAARSIPVIALSVL